MKPIWYTDGACSGNGNPDAIGGWGAICVDMDDTTEYQIGGQIYTRQGKIITGGANKTLGTTNNRMEMEAIIYAVENHIEGYPIIIRSDSAYAVNTFNHWMYSWARNDWRKPSDKKVPENLDLVKRYYELAQEYAIILEKVAGHSNNYWNNYADNIATGKITWNKLIVNNTLNPQNNSITTNIISWNEIMTGENNQYD